MVHNAGRSAFAGPRRRIELDSAEALRLLGSVSLGRIVFTLDGGDVVIRTHEGTALTSYTQQADGPGVVVAYEADDIDATTHLGWSVVVTGYARPVTDPGELDRYQAMLEPWVEQPMDYAIRIRPELVTGILLTPGGRASEG
jgi:hypothetical protein